MAKQEQVVTVCCAVCTTNITTNSGDGGRSRNVMDCSFKKRYLVGLEVVVNILHQALWKTFLEIYYVGRKFELSPKEPILK